MDSYDLIIIGAGPAGMTAGIYAGRARLKTLVLDKTGYGGQMLLIDKVENYPGFKEPVNGFDLAQIMFEQMKQFGAEHKTSTVSKIKKTGSMFKVETEEGAFEAKTVILALGAQPKKLDVPGEDKYVGKGVSYCAVCDGNFFKGKRVAVVGGGNTALSDAEYLARLASHVVVVHRRDQLRADKILVERLQKISNVSFLLSSVVASVEGTASVEGITVKDVKTGNVTKVHVNGVFIFVGQQPQTGFLNGTIKLDEKGFIKRDGSLMTSLPGMFACGDCSRTEFWQLVTACSEGAEAARHAIEHLAGK